MKLFVACPVNIQTAIRPSFSHAIISTRFFTRLKLFAEIESLSGYIIQAGFSTQREIEELIFLQSRQKQQSHITAFERSTKKIYCGHDQETFQYKVNRSLIDVKRIERKFVKENKNNLNLVQGFAEDTIPEYLIEHPEIKIKYLNIDFNDYSASLTALQFLYPRLIPGGLMILENYYKKEDDYRAISDYFRFQKMGIKYLSVNKGPHFMFVK